MVVFGTLTDAAKLLKSQPLTKRIGRKNSIVTSQEIRKGKPNYGGWVGKTLSYGNARRLTNNF
jgi:hypothetical protein